MISPEQIWFHRVPNPGSTRHELRPLSIFCFVFISFSRNSLLLVTIVTWIEDLELLRTDKTTIDMWTEDLEEVPQVLSHPRIASDTYVIRYAMRVATET